MTIPSMSDADFRDRYGPWALISGASEGLSLIHI